MRSGFAQALLLSASLGLSFGCASSGPYWDRDDQKSAERLELEERLRLLESELATARAHERTLAAEVAALTEKMKTLEADGEARLRAAEERALSGARTRIATESALTPSSAATAIEESDLELPPQGEAPAAGEPPQATPASAATDARTAYDRSLAALESGQFAAAEEGFRRFLAENPQSDLADNALFWRAESLLRRGDTAGALAGFRAVVEEHPDGNKVPDALLKVGSCLASLGELESARTVYRELLDRFPETPAAETARLRLAAP